MPVQEIRANSYNCQPGFATLLTKEGIRSLDDVSPGDLIWSGTDWVNLESKLSVGIRDVYSWRTPGGVFIGTSDHRVCSNSIKRKVGNTLSIDICRAPQIKEVTHIPLDVLDGMVFGDGMVHAASNNLVLLCIGKDDQSVFTSEVAPLVGDAYSSDYSFKVKTTIQPEEIPYTYERIIPKRFVKGSSAKKAAFLRGLYSANGSCHDKRISLKAASFSVIIQVQEMLSSIGISSYWTTNPAHKTKFRNGEYTVRESYDLNIGSLPGRLAFRRLIGFVQPHKKLALQRACIKMKAGGIPKTTFDIVKVEDLGKHMVYAIKVNDVDHTYWTGGILAVDN